MRRLNRCLHRVHMLFLTNRHAAYETPKPVIEIAQTAMGRGAVSQMKKGAARPPSPFSCSRQG